MMRGLLPTITLGLVLTSPLGARHRTPCRPRPDAARGHRGRDAIRLNSVSVVPGLDGEDAVGEDLDSLPEFFGFGQRLTLCGMEPGQTTGQDHAPFDRHRPGLRRGCPGLEDAPLGRADTGHRDLRPVGVAQFCWSGGESLIRFPVEPVGPLEVHDAAFERAHGVGAPL